MGQSLCSWHSEWIQKCLVFLWFCTKDMVPICDEFPLSVPHPEKFLVYYHTFILFPWFQLFTTIKNLDFKSTFAAYLKKYFHYFSSWREKEATEIFWHVAWGVGTRCISDKRWKKLIWVNYFCMKLTFLCPKTGASTQWSPPLISQNNICFLMHFLKPWT